MKKLFTLMMLLVAIVIGASADDYVSATQTFKTQTLTRDSCEWSALKSVVTKNTSQSGDGLYFTAGNSNVNNTSGAFGSSAWIIYLQVPSASSNGYVTMVSNSDATDRPLFLNTYDATTNPNAKLVCKKAGSRTTFTADDVVKIGDNYYLQLSNTNSKDVKIKTIGILLNGESYPESVAVDPEFSLTSNSISTVGSSQIIVGNKSGLDGITLSNISYSTSGIVTVDENGVVTPSAAGTTTITFDSEALAGKYNASTGNELSITVTQAVTVFDGAGVASEDILLTLDNVNDKDYLSTNAADKFTDRTWSGYEGKYLDMKSDRTISIKVKNVTSFEFYLSGTKDRKFTIKVGDADAVEYSQSSSSGFVSPGIISTGTTDEVTITIEGGSSTLYPVYFKANPTSTITLGANGYSTFAGEKNFTVSGAKALAAQNKNTSVGFTEIPSTTIIPANTGVVLQGNEGDEVTITYTTEDAGSVTTDMVGVTKANPFVASSNVYVIATKTAGTKFYKYTGSTFPLGKAYLNAAVNAGDAIDIDFDSATAVEAIAEANANSAAPVKVIKNGKLFIGNYNVAGQQVK